MSTYFDLGNHSRSVSTSSPDAQLWFDRGLNWTFAFNHEEAVRCFEKVIEHDPNCAMAHWGIAYALGPNYNKPWDKFDPVDLAQTIARTHEVTGQAMTLLENASPAEQALIQALQARYPSPDVPDAPDPVEMLSTWNDDYADAMRAVYRDFGDDLDVAALFAESMMDRTPWLMWDLYAETTAGGADTEEVQQVLETALENPASQVHPGVLHLYVHLMEMSPFPEKALRVGDWLRDLMPDGGHLKHMPTHIDVLCGHYADVVRSNHDAIIADRKFYDAEGGMNFYTLYRTHNYHFKIYGAMFLGQYEPAMDAAAEMVEKIPEELLMMEQPPLVEYLEPFIPMNLHVMIRFGKWQEIIDAPLPGDQDLYRYTTAVTHYAKGVALAATGRIEEAEEQRAQFQAAVSRVPDTRYLHNNLCLDLLEVAAAMLDGELEYRKGNFQDAFSHLRQAIELEDGLPYDEPWGWMQPARHAYGALLLEQGHVEEAEAIYRADLGLDDSIGRAFQHPENVWSLHGYHECLTRLGKDSEARMIKQRLDLAAARADVPIEASCACRMGVAA